MFIFSHHVFRARDFCIDIGKASQELHLHVILHAMNKTLVRAFTRNASDFELNG